jgi:hypothetical protein
VREGDPVWEEWVKAYGPPGTQPASIPQDTLLYGGPKFGDRMAVPQRCRILTTAVYSSPIPAVYLDPDPEDRVHVNFETYYYFRTTVRLCWDAEWVQIWKTDDLTFEDLTSIREMMSEDIDDL